MISDAQEGEIAGWQQKEIKVKELVHLVSSCALLNEKKHTHTHTFASNGLEQMQGRK